MERWGCNSILLLSGAQGEGGSWFFSKVHSEKARSKSHRLQQENLEPGWVGIGQRGTLVSCSGAALGRCESSRTKDFGKAAEQV